MKTTVGVGAPRAVAADRSLATAASRMDGLTEAVRRFVMEEAPATPCVVVDLAVVAERYRALRRALPEARIHYAVKANPAPQLLRVLVDLGASFDVASPSEIDLCLRAGARPERISYGNTIKKRADIAHAHSLGIGSFAFDSAEELDKLAAVAPGAEVFCRLLTEGTSADWPLSRKFGCSPSMAVDLLLAARRMGLDPVGISFHVGSQQRDPNQWDVALDAAAAVFSATAVSGLSLRSINLGGGFPASYDTALPPIGVYGSRIRSSVRRRFRDRPQLLVEPGRYIAADAGVLFSEVVLVARKDTDDPLRWIYLDVGIFGGLAEALGEAIRYRVSTSVLGSASSPAVLAGPTCDSLDVLYEKHPYELPDELRAGDHVAFLSAGAYTQSYSSVGFNGFAPMSAYCV